MTMQPRHPTAPSDRAPGVVISDPCALTVTNCLLHWARFDWIRHARRRALMLDSHTPRLARLFVGQFYGG